MADMWVCGTCLVKNEANHKSCVCCGISNPQEGSVEDKPSGDLLGQQKTNEILPFVQDSGSFSEEVEQYKVVNRIRMKFKHEDLKHTTLFMSGSGEMEQIPYVCLDRHVSPETNEVEPVYECSIPIPLKDLPISRIKAVECGALHTAFLTSSGVVYTYGCNDMGALGRLPPKTTEVYSKKDPGDTPIKPSNSDGLESWEREPGEVETKFKAKEISCGDNHTLILSISGEVYITGGFKDTSGPIGIADYTSTKGLKKVDYHAVPVKVPISEPIQSIASGENHCVCLAEGGNTIYTFGSNEFSQLIMSNDEVQNPTDTDIDVSVQENLKLLLTWPQLRRVSDITKPPKGKSGDVPPRSGDENESHGKNGATTTTKVRQQSYNTRSMNNKKIVPSARRTRGNRNVKYSKTMSTEQNVTKRGKTVSEVITRIFTGNCTTFFQTKSLKLYGVGRNGQGEVGVGSEELIIEHPRELIFFRGVEITQIRGGQFFTAALVQKRVFVWGSVSYLGLPKEYDTRNLKLEAGDSHESKDPPVNPSGSKRRKLRGTKLTVEEPDGMERLINFDYTRRYNNAFEFGKTTEPVLLPMAGPVNSIFTGSDATFAILFNDTLYSWGSSQNYILGNGKDQYFEETPQMVPSEHFPGFKVVGGAGGSQHTAFIAEKLDPLVMAR